MTTERSDNGGPPRPDEVPLAEAARRLGIPSDTLSRRLRMGNARGVKRLGKWFMAEADLPAAERSGAGPDHSDDWPARVARLEAEVGRLDAALARSQEGEAELRRLVAGVVNALPLALPEASEPRPEPSDQSEASEERPEASAAPPVVAEVPAVPVPARRPWWRRWGP